MQLLLHIGDDKTGTTSIQQALYDARSSLSDKGYLYAVPPRQQNHNYMIMPYKDIITTRAIDRYGSREGVLKHSETIWDYLANEAKKAKPHTIVVSGEILFIGIDTDALMSVFRKRIPQISAVKIVAYLRRPSAKYLASSQQRLKSHPDYVAPKHRDVAAILSNWTDHGSMYLREFSNSTLQDGDVVRDFWKQYLPEHPCPYAPGVMAENVRLSAESLHLMQTYLATLDSSVTNRAWYNKQADRFRATLQCIEQSGNLELTKPKLHDDIVRFLDGPGPHLKKLNQQFGFVYEGLEKAAKSNALQHLLPEREYKSVTDIMTVDHARLEALYKRLMSQMTVPLTWPWTQKRRLSKLSQMLG